jgi:predicted lipid-binding transport protein (Tim44 family)
MFVEIIFLAAIAIFVLTRLFSVMGQDKGAPPPTMRPDQQREERPRPVHVVPDPAEDEEDEEMVGGLERIARADPSFSQKEFTKGAKAAYEMIVKAFAEGDRPTLQNLLTQDVYEDYDAAIKAREASGAEPLELMRLKDASIEAGSLVGSVAEITMLFSAELTNGERISKTREFWTFERDTQSRDPNWRLSDVSAA